MGSAKEIARAGGAGALRAEAPLPAALGQVSIWESKMPLVRCYSGADPLNMQFIHDRVMLVLNLFDKIDNNKLTPEAHFLNDLGLDSLDHVEIMLMIEDEFDLRFLMITVR